MILPTKLSINCTRTRFPPHPPQHSSHHFDDSHFNRYEVTPHWYGFAFPWRLMILSIYFFTNLLTIWISSLGKMSIQFHCPFLKQIILLLLSCMNTVHMLNINPYPYVFSPIPWATFSFYWLFLLLWRRCLVLCICTCWFWFYCLCFWCHSQKNHCQTQCQGAFSPYFLLGIL